VSKCRARVLFEAPHVAMTVWCQLPAEHEGGHSATAEYGEGKRVTYTWPRPEPAKAGKP
jgi:hypothetical protein